MQRAARAAREARAEKAAAKATGLLTGGLTRRTAAPSASHGTPWGRNAKAAVASSTCAGGASRFSTRRTHAKVHRQTLRKPHPEALVQETGRRQQAQWQLRLLNWTRHLGTTALPGSASKGHWHHGCTQRTLFTPCL